MPLIRSLGKGKGIQHLLSSYCVPSPWCPLILKGPWEVTAATLLCRVGNGGAGRDSGHSWFGTSQPRAQVLATPKPSTWRAVEVRHRLRCLGAARVLRESPAGTSPSVLVASLPGPPELLGEHSLSRRVGPSCTWATFVWSPVRGEKQTCSLVTARPWPGAFVS